MVIIIDSNIILDVLLKRMDFFECSKTVFDFCVSGRIKGYLAAHSMTNIWYILRKEYLPQERRELMMALFDYFEIASVDKEKLYVALRRESFADFEDCLQDECAREVCADYIITRNKKDFSNSVVPALVPEEFIALMRQGFD